MWEHAQFPHEMYRGFGPLTRIIVTRCRWTTTLLSCWFHHCCPECENQNLSTNQIPSRIHFIFPNLSLSPNFIFDTKLMPKLLHFSIPKPSPASGGDKTRIQGCLGIAEARWFGSHESRNDGADLASQPQAVTSRTTTLRSGTTNRLMGRFTLINIVSWSVPSKNGDINNKNRSWFLGYEMVQFFHGNRHVSTDTEVKPKWWSG